MDPQWLDWSKRLQAIAQNGLYYAKDVYDRERYTELRHIASQMMAAGAGIDDAERVVGLFSHDQGYMTPKVDVRAGVIADGRILLVREREDGLWTVPGGWADVGDAPSVAAVREVREESGYIVAARKLVAFFDRNAHPHPSFPFHAYKVFFLCDLIGGAAEHSIETDGVAWFAEDALPPLSLTRVLESQIRLLFEHRQRPDLPTAFD